MMWVSLVVILPLFWKGITGQIPGYSIQVDYNVGVQEGLCVTIPCTFFADYRNRFSNSSGYWILVTEPKTPFYIVASNDKFSDVKTTNFHLTGNPDNGDCTLTITDARKEDEGPYYYRFEKSKDSKIKYNYGQITTTITVTDLTEEPVISDPGTLTAGINTTLTCSPPRNCSPTSLNFQWTKSDVTGVWMKNSSTITFTPSISDHQKTITCEMSNTKGKITRKAILLDVCCPTSISITWDIIGKRKNRTDNVIRQDEGSSVIMKCSVKVEGNLTLQIIWTNEKNDILQNGTGNYLELQLDDMTTTHTGVYTCSVLTDYVIKSENINVTVQYPPRNMEITIQSSTGEELPGNQSVVINQTESLTLACKVDGNPNSSVIWVKGEIEVETPKMSKSVSSAIINVSSSMVDVYRCLAWNALGLREQRIQVGLKPSIKPIKTENISYRDTALAFLCGMSVTILIVLVYKLITWKKWRKEKSYMQTKEPSESAELPENEIYMNVSKTEHKAEESADTSTQLDPNGVMSEDLHYSTVAFSAKPSKVPSTQPETEYAEINVK
ncbi:sialic acid-binding Ig-like lectin 13 isoform X1 [Anomaloglossus baeobatrachus]|uniref:sialic acid-binding Ig-like lectin 13 isoform X1 n=1 Tax=Anomaloglossus baeobatrachus TaxID=238106 RepID=UPI003F4FE635